MDVDNGNMVTKPETDRMIMCEVCANNKAKYTCPSCEVRTCCLECVKIHKKELDCNGLRDKVKFKRLKTFNNIDLLNDYRLLEETARVVSKSVKLPPISCFYGIQGLLPGDLYRLRSTALSRGVHLHFLPPSFTRHITNTSFLDHKSQDLFWRIDWIFPQAGKISFTDNRVLDSSILSACVHKYIEPNEMEYPSLSFYQSAGHSGIKLLLKAERTAPNRYYLLDPSTSLRNNLSGKSLIEYPVIYVVLNHHIYSFNVFTEEEEQNLGKKSRRRHYKNKNKPTFKNNFFFSTNNEKEDDESKGEMSGIPDPGENNDVGNSSYQPRTFRHQSRGGRQNYYKNKRHLSRGRGRRGRFPRMNGNDSSEHAVNGILSSNLNSVHI